MVTMSTNGRLDDTAVDNITLQPVKTMVVCAGGTGNETGVNLKVITHPDDPVVFLGVDVMPTAPTVFVPDGAGSRAVTFEAGVEYIRIGVDMDLPRLRAELRAHPGRREHLAWLLHGLPASMIAQSVESGTKARRRLAAAALEWSRADVERGVERAFRKLNDVRVKDRAGKVVENAPINVVIIGSLAGGVGSATAFPIAGIVKSTMDRLGAPSHRSMFSLFAVGADAFNETSLRLNNEYDTLADIEASQVKGVVLCDD